MSACLDDARIQAVADGEATPIEVAHGEGCVTCRTRVADARAAVHDFAHGMSNVNLPSMLAARVNAAVARPAAERSGATTLLRRPPQRPAWLFAGGAAAAVAVIAIVFVLLPSVDPETRLSAAEILDRSMQTLTVQGTERLRYELSIEAPAAATAESGTFVIEQLIDHQTGRWRFSRFAPDGTVLNGIAENPSTNTREAIIRFDGRTYHFHFDIADDQRLPLWDLQRRYAETMIRMVQASGAQVVTTEQGPDGERYVMDLPAADHPPAPAPFDLDLARVVVDSSDFHIIEFSAAGTVMGERVSVGYRLNTRTILGGRLPDTEFTFGPPDPESIELRGEGTRELPHDLLSLLLREIARGRR
jgi:hypothetical protein